MADGICFPSPNFCPESTSHKIDSAHECEIQCKKKQGSSQYAITNQGGMCVCCIGPVVESIPGYCAYGAYGNHFICPT